MFRATTGVWYANSGGATLEESNPEFRALARNSSAGMGCIAHAHGGFRAVRPEAPWSPPSRLWLANERESSSTTVEQRTPSGPDPSVQPVRVPGRAAAGPHDGPARSARGRSSARAVGDAQRAAQRAAVASARPHGTAGRAGPADAARGRGLTGVANRIVRTASSRETPARGGREYRRA